MDDRFHDAPKCVHGNRRGPDGVAVHGRRSCGRGKSDTTAAGGPRGSPRVDVVFCFWQCDKENHGWREGPPLTVPCESSDLLAGPSPSGKVSFEQKKNTAFRRSPRTLTQNIGRLFRQTADVRGPEPRPAVELPILPHIVPSSAPARGGQAAVSGGMGCCRRLWLRLATLIFPNRTCRSLGTSFASAGLFAPVLDKTHDISTTSRSRVISTHSGEVPLSYGTGF